MKTLIKILTLVCVMTLMSCAASKEEVLSYHKTIETSNQLIIETVQTQANHNAQRRMDSMVHFSRAMTEAAKTDDPSDNATIAFAWGFVTAQPDTIEQPKISFPAAPVTSVDALRAWTPIVGMAVPLVTPFLYGWASGNDGTSQSIAADNGSTIVLESGNAGAYKSSVGGNSVVSELNQEDWRIVDNSTHEGGVGTELPGGGVGVEGGGTDMILSECLANPPGGYKGDTPMLTATMSCRSAGLLLTRPVVLPSAAEVTE